MNTTDSMETIKELSKRLNRLEKELEKVRGKEYSMPFGSMRRARMSRKWDMLAKEKNEILNKMYAHQDYEDGMRTAENETIIDP